MNWMIQKLVIGDYEIHSVKQVTLSSSMTSPIDVLTVELPQNKKIDRSKIKKGDKIEWHAGYRESGLIK
ncbi:MAG: hypothetical protein AAF518_26765, partial [Spirochaetota bacterium]